ncbi:hypothetical protein CF386_11880 [Paraphotobacterium marinum]|uniref:AB hydrolase-1 domain-containing protein n=1 Tax=Paraphotobacterium marinum TaxID=1755811 RepID=A0A220VH87_9GAMM|nr:alpha/beta hydrolase [Paraphotobacterium marinum]ASK79735.1 hypothetical protein CF386_11880 [Paraphotobacterium marinum]
MFKRKLKINNNLSVNYYQSHTKHLNDYLKKTPVILIHGIYGNSEIFKNNFFEYFADDNLVFALDFVEDANTSLLNTHVRQLNFLLEHIGRPCNIVSFSFGGVIAQKSAETHNELIKKLVLVSSPPPVTLSVVQLNLMLKYPRLAFAFNHCLLAHKSYEVLPWIIEPIRKAMFLNDRHEDEYFNFLHNGFSLNLQYYYNNIDHIINLESLKKIKKLVISLNDDMMIDCSLTQMGANLLGADIQSFDNIGHAVPFSNLWKDVAEYISLWMNIN